MAVRPPLGKEGDKNTDFGLGTQAISFQGVMLRC